MGSISVSQVGKTYPGAAAPSVSGVDLEIADGEFLVLVGPSGCGKSTLLRMIAGLETVTEGTISIGGREVNTVDPADRDIAMVFQNYALYPHMSVRDNLAYGLRNRRVPKPEIDARVAEAARMLELGRYLDRKPRALSGGQRQRVAMGRAIVREPAVFLFDEPLSNLDAKLRVQMRGEIKQLQARLGTTSVYVTHDQLEAMTLAHRLVVLNGGRVEQVGRPLELYHQPASAFVAGFIGSPAMNLLDADCLGGQVRLGPAVMQIPGVPDGPAILGIRPESLLPAYPGSAGAFALDILYVEELGAQRLVHGQVGGQALVAALPSSVEIGPELWLSPAQGSLHVFDIATGRRIATQAPARAWQDAAPAV
ncbi:sn-glycerol-3-phosphate import ATP-binding protein UgpC [Poseidonocella sp. HB161398]|uniref:sn-glycerol-3-phosphate import ATP-binding protein UgpC n=1 Tax=Poseidonocella sp. HB161398 TaxID=2320855 RepID=UPI0011090A62|nr:sn-glycerol-3-phosphate import ATP-binding protein UgpC [Poseidonocella sp. HB161398]